MWYSAALLFESVHPDPTPGQSERLYEESIRLIQAGSEDDARTKAEYLGREGEHTYKTASGEKVEWRFVKVMDMHEILVDNLEDGTEIFSRFHRFLPS